MQFARKVIAITVILILAFALFQMVGGLDSFAIEVLEIGKALSSPLYR